MNIEMKKFCKFLKQYSGKLFNTVKKTEGKMETKEKQSDLEEDMRIGSRNTLRNFHEPVLFPTKQKANQYRKNSGIWWLMKQDEDKLWNFYKVQLFGVKLYSRLADEFMVKYLTPISTFAIGKPISIDAFKKYRSLKSIAGSQYKWTLCNRNEPTKAEKINTIDSFYSGLKTVRDALPTVKEATKMLTPTVDDGSYVIPEVDGINILERNEQSFDMTCPYCKESILIANILVLSKSGKALEENSNFVHKKISFGDE